MHKENSHKRRKFDANYPKGTEQNPMVISVRMESSKNKTLTITLSKAVIANLGMEIKKGDKVVQWADINNQTICVARL